MGLAHYDQRPPDELHDVDALLTGRRRHPPDDVHGLPRYRQLDGVFGLAWADAAVI